MIANTQRLHSQICTHFEPYRQFFLQESIAEIVPPNPSYKPILNSKVRDNLNIPRQIMYLKNIVPHDFCEQIIDEQLSKPNEQFTIKRGLITAHYKGFLYWSFDTRLMRFKNNNAHQNWIATQTRGTELINIHESILEIKIHADKLYLRCSRQIVVIDSHNFTILKCWKLQNQILGFYIEQDQIIICNEQQGQTIFRQATKDEQLNAFSTIDGIVNSFWNFTDNQLIFSQRNSINILDRRTKNIQNLYHFEFNHTNRIYSASPLKNTYWGSQYLVTMESYNACIYDLRKCSQPVTKIKHYCEQSPPSVLQLYSGQQPDYTSAQTLTIDTLNTFLQQFQKKQQKSLLQNPLLVATSPYEIGSSIFAELSMECLSTSNSSLFQFKNKFFNKFQLLFDTGKIHTNSYPLSGTPILLQSQIAFFHLDCYYGIYLQIFDRKIDHPNLKKKQSLECQGYERINFIRAHGIQKSLDPNQTWFLQNTMEQQLNLPHCDYWQKIIQEDDDLLLEGNCYQNRHIRYANLTQFYHKINEQAKTKKVKNIVEKQVKQIIKHIQQDKLQHLNDQQRTQPFTQNQRMYNHTMNRQILLDEDLEQLSLDWNTFD